jgi:hypothetical protein
LKAPAAAKGFPEGREAGAGGPGTAALGAGAVSEGGGTETALGSLDKLNCEKASSLKKGFGFDFSSPGGGEEEDAIGLDTTFAPSAFEEKGSFAVKSSVKEEGNAVFVLSPPASPAPPAPAPPGAKGLFIGGGIIGAGGRKGSATFDPGSAAGVQSKSNKSIKLAAGAGAVVDAAVVVAAAAATSSVAAPSPAPAAIGAAALLPSATSININLLSNAFCASSFTSIEAATTPSSLIPEPSSPATRSLIASHAPATSTQYSSLTAA